MDDFRTEMTARTRSFALRVIGLCSGLHGRYEVEHVGKQLLRSATSVAANFRAAGYAKSSADFYAKLKSCEEKAVAACFWLEFIRDGNMLPEERVVGLISEVQGLVAILASACRKSNDAL